MDKQLAQALIKRHESCELTVYLDTRGNPTVGWGHMDHSLAVGDTISQNQADAWLTDDLRTVYDDLARLPWVNALCGTRQAVIADMAYNMGAADLKKFRHMIERLQARQWWRAAYEMLNGNHIWLNEVGYRAVEDSIIIATAQTPDWYHT